MQRRIGIIGAGPVGTALASGLSRAGHDVVIGARRPAEARYQDLAIDVVAVADAVEGADVVVLAVPAEALGDLVPALGLGAGQVLVDATNAVFTPIPDGFDTIGDFVASLAPADVAFVKAFNTVGAEHLAGGAFDPPTFLPIAGDAQATTVVASLADDLGFDVADLGGREAIGLVEAHARLWIHLAIRRGWGRDFAWSVVRR
jgi:8-hydroxy-5-deazaflavin:NADPH oxidoreductase